MKTNYSEPVGGFRRAFTFVELLAILAIMALWACLLAPALTHTQPNSQAAQCANNLRQLTTAWRLYATDFSGRFVPNPGVAGAPTGTDNWTVGWLDWNYGSPAGANTNISYVVDALLGPYAARQAGLYKCPADKIPSMIGPRVRSYSMNGFVGGSFELRVFGLTAYRIYLLDSDLVAPAPARTFVLLDEHPDSINDGVMAMRMPATAQWPTNVTWSDLPASAHNGACGISFADGHVEVHKWADATTRAPVLKTLPVAIGQTSVNDSAWLVGRASAPR